MSLGEGGHGRLSKESAEHSKADQRSSPPASDSGRILTRIHWLLVSLGCLGLVVVVGAAISESGKADETREPAWGIVCCRGALSVGGLDRIRIDMAGGGTNDGF